MGEGVKFEKIWTSFNPNPGTPGRGFSVLMLELLSDFQQLSAAAAAAAAKSLQSCQTLCDPKDGSPLGSSVPGILQARILEWAAISFSRCLHFSLKESESEVAQSCPTLCNPMDCSLPGSSVHGIFGTSNICLSSPHVNETPHNLNLILKSFFEMHEVS